MLWDVTILSFYVDDNATEDEIKQKVDDVAEMSVDYHVEEGYIAEQLKLSIGKAALGG